MSISLHGTEKKAKFPVGPTRESPGPTFDIQAMEAVRFVVKSCPSMLSTRTPKPISTAVCGTRGWTLPGPGAAPEDEKIYHRELLRMEMSLERAMKLSAQRLVVMCHYPPLGEGGAETPLSQLLDRYPIDDVVYGHLHGPALRGAVTGEIHGIRYHCVSCDGLKFQLYRLPDGKVETAPI